MTPNGMLASTRYGFAGSGTSTRVRTQHGDVAGGFEPPCQDRDELGIELDCQHLCCSLCERVREHSTPGAELDHPVVACDAGVGEEL